MASKDREVNLNHMSWIDPHKKREEKKKLMELVDTISQNQHAYEILYERAQKKGLVKKSNGRRDFHLSYYDQHFHKLLDQRDDRASKLPILNLKRHSEAIETNLIHKK
jgi:hypothetical protein